MVYLFADAVDDDAGGEGCDDTIFGNGVVGEVPVDLAAVLDFGTGVEDNRERVFASVAGFGSRVTVLLAVGG